MGGFFLSTRNLSDSPYIAFVSNYDRDPIDLVGQETTKAERAAKERLAKEVADSDLKWLASKPRGRRIIWRLLTQSRVFQSSFSPNALQMAFNEGYRNYGNWMLDTFNALCPELYSVMTKESIENARSGNGDNTN